VLLHTHLLELLLLKTETKQNPRPNMLIGVNVEKLEDSKSNYQFHFWVCTQKKQKQGLAQVFATPY
jgi:hypothetical protein